MNNNQPFQTKRTREIYDRLTTLNNSVWKCSELYELATVKKQNVLPDQVRTEKQKLKLSMAKLLNAIGEIESTIEDLQW